jgi:hypothetical protein
MRTGFELKIVAETVTEAKAIALREISRFLEIPEESVEDSVAIELKVSYPKAETISEIETLVEARIFQITAYGSVKQSVTGAFGF